MTAEPRSPSDTDRDPDLIRRWSKVFNGLATPFSPQVVGAENLPVTGPVLVVGNHSLLWPIEVWATASAIFDRRGIEAPVVGLAYDLLFTIPWLGSQLRRVGVVPAAEDAAADALRRGELVMVYPGGDLDACRPVGQRDRVELGEHRGFVKLALRQGVPLVPVVTHGGTHSTVILARGDRLARLLRLDAIRVKVFPIFAGLPFGIESVLTPPLPLPVGITVEVLRPLDWSRLGNHAADDPEVVDACYRETVEAMQAALDRLSQYFGGRYVAGSDTLSIGLGNCNAIYTCPRQY